MLFIVILILVHNGTSGYRCEIEGHLYFAAVISQDHVWMVGTCTIQGWGPDNPVKLRIETKHNLGVIEKGKPIKQQRVVKALIATVQGEEESEAQKIEELENQNQAMNHQASQIIGSDDENAERVPEEVDNEESIISEERKKPKWLHGVVKQANNPNNGKGGNIIEVRDVYNIKTQGLETKIQGQLSENLQREKDQEDTNLPNVQDYKEADLRNIQETLVPDFKPQTTNNVNYEKPIFTLELEYSQITSYEYHSNLKQLSITYRSRTQETFKLIRLQFKNSIDFTSKTYFLINMYLSNVEYLLKDLEQDLNDEGNKKLIWNLLEMSKRTARNAAYSQVFEGRITLLKHIWNISNAKLISNRKYIIENVHNFRRYAYLYNRKFYENNAHKLKIFNESFWVEMNMSNPPTEA
jgi:hypothetical protein